MILLGVWRARRGAELIVDSAGITLVGIPRLFPSITLPWIQIRQILVRRSAVDIKLRAPYCITPAMGAWWRFDMRLRIFLGGGAIWIGTRMLATAPEQLVNEALRRVPAGMMPPPIERAR